MLSKLLKNDLKKNSRMLIILFSISILVAGMTRGCQELGENISFFRIFGIFLDSVFYSFAANAIIQPFLRNFLNFTKSLYKDESYLTHTLPVSKNQIIKSKFLTAIIEITAGVLCFVVSLIIKFVSPTMIETLKMILSTIISGNISMLLTLMLFVVLVIVEFLMFISIIFLAIIIGYRAREKRVLKTFLIVAALSFSSLFVLSICMIVVLLLNDVSLTSTTLILSNNAFIGVMLTGIIVYSCVTLLMYLLSKREFNKGVNVD